MKTKIWTNDEILFLQNSYSIMGSADCALALNRTQDSIKMKAYKLGIQSPRSKKRTNQEYDNLLFNMESEAYRVDNYINDKTPILHECIKEHKWKASPFNVLRGSGCPYCAVRGFNFDKPGVTYFVSFEFEGFTYYKIGVTNKTPQERLSEDWKRRNIQVVWSTPFSKGADAYSLEQRLKRENASYLIDTGGLVSGNSETFTVQIEKPGN